MNFRLERGLAASRCAARRDRHDDPAHRGDDGDRRALRHGRGDAAPLRLGAGARAGDGVRRILPQPAADPRRVLGVLRAADLDRLGLSPLATGLAALALNVTAYNAETFRAGINSIRRGQVEAAMALGMSRDAGLRRVVVPQALRRILPVLASTWVSLFKDTSLVSVIAVSELAYVAMQIRAQTLPRARDADRDGGDLLAAGLSAGQARRLDPAPIRGDRMNDRPRRCRNEPRRPAPRSSAIAA